MSPQQSNEASILGSDLVLRLRVEALYAEYAQTIDDDRFEDWPELFVDSAKYRITTRENHGKDLSLAIMYCVTGEE